MADIKTANLAKLVTKQAGRAKEKVREHFKFWDFLGLFWGLKPDTCVGRLFETSYASFMHYLLFFGRNQKTNWSSSHLFVL